MVDLCVVVPGHTLRALNSQATRHPARPDLRHPPIPAQIASVVLSARCLLPRYLAVQLEAVMVAHCRFMVCAQVGSTEKLDRPGTGHCRVRAVAHWREY